MNTKQNSDKIYTSDSPSRLLRMGWTDHFQRQLDEARKNDLIPARVVGVRKNIFCVSNGEKEWLATVAGKLMHQSGGLYPVTGDWVLLTGTVIAEVLARRNTLSRGAAGTRGKESELPKKEQIIAANLDAVFIVCGLDRDFNLRRIERYLTLVYNSGLDPVIVLTKADLHQDPEQFTGQVETIAFGVPVYAVSVLDDGSLKHLEGYLSPGKTITMVGSSGAGKSTLVNRLYGKTVQAVNTISESVGKGRHTTTTRDLIVMPGGGMVIDNPGIREIAFWDDDGGIGAAFPEIERFAGNCRFPDCSHTHEPGCRVLQAVEEGAISPGRLENFRKMERELTYLSQRQHKSADRMEKERWKAVALKIKDIQKKKRIK